MSDKIQLQNQAAYLTLWLEDFELQHCFRVKVSYSDYSTDLQENLVDDFHLNHAKIMKMIQDILS